MNVSRRDAASVVGAAIAAGLLLREGTAEARCPRIVGALDAIRAAKEELEAAGHDFGGHKAAAIQACQGAIDELKRCLEHPQCR